MRTALFIGITLMAAGFQAAAAPITTTYSVQFISVCDDFGNNCAPVPLPSNPADPARNLDNPLDVMNRAYEQQGVRFVPVMSGNSISVKHLNATALQNPDLRVDAQLNSVTSADGFAQLTRGTELQNIGVSPSSSTLNVFFVNDLRALDVNGNPIANSVLRGVGWLNGNGVIVDREARLDTVAHEIGHNLGLSHDPTPTNLMASGDNRKPITTTINDVNPNGQKLDQLTAAQGVDIRGPLFANGTARILNDCVCGSSAGSLDTGIFTATRFYDFNFDTAPTDRRLTKIQLFYSAGSEVEFVPDFTTPGTRTKTVTSTSVILEDTFATPLAPGGAAELATWLGHSVVLPVPPGAITVDTDPAFPVHPLFIRYVFDNGVASQALFDANGNMASDDPNNQFFFFGTPDENGRPLALQSDVIEIALEVPEPGTLALLGSTLIAFTLWRGRRSRSGPVAFA